MIEAICWDVGGVFTYRPHDAIESMAEEFGTSVDALRHAVLGPLDHDSDHPWHRLERGEIELGLGWAEIAELLSELGVDLDMRAFLTRMAGDGADRSIVTATAGELAAAGLRMVVITNNVREFRTLNGRGWETRVPIDLMELVVDSSDLGMRKPSAAIYQHVLDALGVEPGAAVMVDDTQANLDGAAALGMETILVAADPAPAMAELRALAGLS